MSALDPNKEELALLRDLQKHARVWNKERLDNFYQKTPVPSRRAETPEELLDELSRIIAKPRKAFNRGQ